MTAAHAMYKTDKTWWFPCGKHTLVGLAYLLIGFQQKPAQQGCQQVSWFELCVGEAFARPRVWGGGVGWGGGTNSPLGLAFIFRQGCAFLKGCCCWDSGIRCQEPNSNCVPGSAGVRTVLETACGYVPLCIVFLKERWTGSHRLLEFRCCTPDRQIEQIEFCPLIQLVAGMGVWPQRCDPPTWAGGSCQKHGRFLDPGVALRCL